MLKLKHFNDWSPPGGSWWKVHGSISFSGGWKSSLVDNLGVDIIGYNGILMGIYIYLLYIYYSVYIDIVYIYILYII